MFLLLLLLGVANAVQTERYLSAIRSPTKLLGLYNDLTHGTTSRAELPLRLRLLRSELERITASDNNGQQWTESINKFSIMTPGEKDRYLGVNLTSLVTMETKPRLSSEEGGNPVPPVSMDWRHLCTGVKDQESCGSCWAFSAVAPLETTYAQVTGKLKQFSEKEMVDCSYDDGRDSCRGGWITNGWRYSIKAGRLATTASAPYLARDDICSYGNVPNGYQAATLTDYYHVGSGVNNLVQGLAGGVVAVGYRVSTAFYSYHSGGFKDETCYTDFRGYHAVAAVGYTPNSVIFRNSWGADWGDKGYFQWDRTHSGCEIFNYGHMVMLSKTGQEDTDPEWREEKEDGEEDDDECGECPCGTVMCGDGVCRHEHMC